MIRTRFCGYRTCWTLIVLTPGTEATNRCHEHQGVANAPESDAEFVARVCRDMGWRRGRGGE